MISSNSSMIFILMFLIRLNLTLRTPLHSSWGGSPVGNIAVYDKVPIRHHQISENQQNPQPAYHPSIFRFIVLSSCIFSQEISDSLPRKF